MLISLIGYRGTGKTTVGVLLAERLGWRCVDTDLQVEERVGMSIRDLFQQCGEPEFRKYETQVIREWVRHYKVVLSLGGGAILSEENRQRIRVAGPVVWLTASPEELHRRIHGDDRSALLRPNLTSQGGLEEVKRVLADRLPLYEECADIVVDTENRKPAEIVDQILGKLQLPVDSIS